MGNRKWAGLGALAFLLLLILDAGTAAEGMRSGITLCLRTVIPSLFPFFVCSMVLNGSLTGQPFHALRPLSRFCRIPRGSEALLLTGLLGGYPVGAHAVAEAYSSGHLDRRTARRMLAFCSNAGPAFLFGMLLPIFENKNAVWVLWLVHITSALLVGKLYPGGGDSTVRLPAGKRVSLAEVVPRAGKVMAGVCCWVVLFRTILALLGRWLDLNTSAGVALTGILELSNGCLAVSIFQKDGTKFLLCGMFLAFGGLCVAMQTAGVVGDLGLGSYFAGKLLQSSISFLLCLLLEFVLFPTQERWLSPWLVLGFLPGMAAGFLIFREKCGIMEASSTRRLPYAVPKEN